MERISRYQLQLDSMDLNYLPISFSRDFTKTAPLWSFGSDSNEYFEFEIRNKVDDNIQDSTITATCYICAIEVPKLFFKDHCKSKRHYINKCIAETALDRMKKHLQNKEDCEITNDVCDTYFCPECVVTVSQKDQKSHENLQSHKYLAMFDNLFENLYKIYANESDTKNTQDGADISHITDSSKINSIKLDWDPNDSIQYVNNKRQPDEPNVSLDSSKLNRYSISDLKGLDVDCDSSDTSISKTLIDKANNVLKSKEFVSEECESKSNFTSIPFDKDSFENNELSNCISVDGDNFNCNVCYSTFNKNSLNSHINGSRHKMNKVSRVHYMMKESGNDLYCIVCCNILENSVKSAKDHCKGSNHTMLYKKILKENGIRLTRSQIHCELCDKTIPKRNEFVHIFGCKQHHKKRSNNSFCSVCDILIPNNEVKNHDNSDLHKTKLECKQDKFINGNNKAIINMTRNAETMEDTSSNETKTSEPYFCVICLVNVPNTPKNIEMHNNGASHRKKAQQYSEIIVVPESSVKSEVNEANSIYYCDICQCSLHNSSDMIAQHIIGTPHIKKLIKLQESLHTTKELPISKQGEKKAEIVCKVCKVRVPNTKTNISEHGKGKVHLNNYKLTLESENIVSDDNKHYCQSCNVYIENPLKHIEGKNHKNKNKLHIKNLSFKTTLNGDETTNQLSITEAHVAEESILVKTDSTMDQNCSVSDVKTQEQIPLVSGYNNMCNENLSDPEKIDSSPSYTASDKSTLILEHENLSDPEKIDSSPSYTASDKSTLILEHENLSDPEKIDSSPSYTASDKSTHILEHENLSDPEKIDSSPSYTASDKSTLILEHDSKKTPLKIEESNTVIPSSLKEKPNVVQDDQKLLKSEWITILDGEYYCKICSTSLLNVKNHINDRMHRYLHPRFPY
ncbi:uncharacterized protein LOC125061363 isoform X1 [Pieris napi]|uniref:uncharacterized protein LOC125061363 isoform X1 n=1 Tax=Pieris napi TaxID=78633 RepID=UPI001FB87857|nr:uncharacterized protein LOC125061363 isoform X1 [Pieris napi]XP_047522720.1 uncharacterized protein LOC125061363 isoform X1 [Pieris napi]